MTLPATAFPQIWDWLYSNSAAVQAAASLVTLFLTFVLVWATLRYVKATKDSLQVAREQLEREWRPDLHVKLRADAGRVFIDCTNLGRAAVLADAVLLEAENGEKSQAAVDLPILPGKCRPIELTSELRRYHSLSPGRDKERLLRATGGRAVILGFPEDALIFSVALRYISGGTSHESEHIPFATHIMESYVGTLFLPTRMDMTIPPIQRTRGQELMLRARIALSKLRFWRKQ